ncbi:MAG TPA: MFS transporter [Gammaproteobacteria bacterium]|nr:MFS transporter [Gammaproteobacteria bacterium]
MILFSKKYILAGSIGTLIEWAEFCFYGYMVVQFSHLFFPMLTANASIIAGFGTFAMSYIARPLGSIIFGHIGDKLGRQKSFSASILLMSIATLGIGLLPTYASIGILAPILLISMRFLQGLAVAGEYPSASVFIIENNPLAPWFSSSWVATASAAGMLLGGAAAAIVSLSSMPVWAWRVPFCLGFFACVLAFYIRRHLAESPAYQQLLQSHKVEAIPIKTVLKYYQKPLLQTAAIGAFVGIFVYTCNVWWITFVIEKGYFSEFQARTLATITMCCVTIATPLMGMLAQKWQGRRLMILGLVGDIMVVPLLFLISATQSFWAMCLMGLFYGLCHAAFTAPMFKYFADIFPIQVRYSGQAFGWNIAVAIFGSSAPLLAQMLARNDLVWVLVSYVVMFGLIALGLNGKTRGSIIPSIQRLPS